VVAVTTNSVEELRRLHDPSPEVTAAVGRLATGTLLLASTLGKITGREPLLTVEVNGGGPAGRLVATASPASS
jgi:molecular chaperone Hsp33